MGRDFFDVVYLFGKTKPHMGYLRNKLAIESDIDMKKKLMERCAKLNFKLLAEDAKPFIYRAKDIDRILLFRDWLHSIWTRKKSRFYYFDSPKYRIGHLFLDIFALIY